MPNRCDTCHTETDDDLLVYALPGVPMSVGNCQVCADWNCYPWLVLLGNTASLGGMEHAADWWKDAVRVSCARIGKTAQQFVDGVQEAINDIGAMEAGG